MSAKRKISIWSEKCWATPVEEVWRISGATRFRPIKAELLVTWLDRAPVRVANEERQISSSEIEKTTQTMRFSHCWTENVKFKLKCAKTDLTRPSCTRIAVFLSCWILLKFTRFCRVNNIQILIPIFSFNMSNVPITITVLSVTDFFYRYRSYCCSLWMNYK